MGCCNEPVNTLTGTAPDPSQHVNYARGMVLGVDDFVQEFAYLAERAQWLARDAIGYGTVAGLRVFAENDGVEGPRLHVSAGSALVPSGKHVCVPADQCAVINRWLAKPDNAAIVNRLLNPSSPPMSPPLPPLNTDGTVSLYLTLCCADCKTRPVPIPGEPCRSEDELMAPSRIADDFRLELREFAPVQTEEDALRDFVRWLRGNVEVVDLSSPSLIDEAAWVLAMTEGAQAWLSGLPTSPPLSPPASFASLGDYLFDLATPISVARTDVCTFLRVAIRFWVTTLRPLWMAMRCHAAQQGDTNCVLLARVSFDIQWIGGSPTGAWQVTGSPAGLQIDESTRPVLAHLRLMQEWMMCGCDCGFDTAAAAMAGPPGPTPAPPAPAPVGPPIVPLLRIGARLPVAPVSPLHLPLATVRGDLTLDDSHYYVLAKGATKLKVTLPPSVPELQGRVYVVKNVDVGALSVSLSGRDTLDDAAGISIAKGRAATLIADGAGHWYEVGDGTGNTRARRPA
jgi:hypothetical protein